MAIHELISGPLVRRLSGMTDHRAELDHCSREMFALTMLIRLGRITEQDVRSTFAAFHKLDKHNQGFISQKEVQANTFSPIAGVGDFLPKQRNDSNTSTENSSLLHPLTMNRDKERANSYGSYNSLSRVPEQMSRVDSLLSGMTDEHWEDHP